MASFDTDMINHVPLCIEEMNFKILDSSNSKPKPQSCTEVRRICTNLVSISQDEKYGIESIQIYSFSNL